MRCEECRALLRSLVDGRMDGRTRRKMGLHLAECDECSALIEQERFWDDALLGYLDHELPPDLRSEILGDLADVETPATETISRLDRLDRRSRWRLMAWAATRDFADPMQWLRTAAVAAAALLAVWWWTGDRQDEPRPFTEPAPIVHTAPDGTGPRYDDPPTGRLSLSGRMI